ncbi:MAG: hypothetical protein HYY06_05795 [Deltaproteobacteria bacterium]|nr:hypothetical protein [Deltaproteobacteria bacterium]
MAAGPLLYSSIGMTIGGDLQLVVFEWDFANHTFGDPEIAVVGNEQCPAVDKPTLTQDLLGGLHVAFLGTVVSAPVCTASKTEFGPGEEWSEPVALTGPDGIADCSENCEFEGCDLNPIIRTAMPGAYGGAIYMTSEGAVVNEKDSTRNICLWLGNALLWPPAWELVAVVANVNPKGTHDAANGELMRTWGATTAFDIALDGTLVVAFTDRVVVGTEDRDHVFITYSDPGGAIWAEPREVSPGGDWEEFQPTVSAHDESGVWAVTFYSTERDPENQTAVDVLAVTATREAIFQRRRLTRDTPDGAVPFEPCATTDRSYFGHYNGTAALPGVFRFYTAWGDSRLGCAQQGVLADTYHQHVYGARWR